MNPYNAPFFSLYENVFLTYRKQHGEKAALDFMRTLFERGLKRAYDATGFTQGKEEDFVRVVGERDDGVGIRVEFPEVSPDRIVYQFHTDPFPGLKGEVDPHLLDDTYLRFKVEYLLGPDWTYETTRHIWKGTPYSEHVIRRRKGA